MEFGQSYYFQGIRFYIHDPERPLIFMYRTKEFIVIKQNSFFRISVYPHTVTNKRVMNWIETQIGAQDRIITPGRRILSYRSKIIRNKTEFIYFIFNPDSSAIKIGKAKNVFKRLRDLQTGSPAELKLFKIIDATSKEARETEQRFHQKFRHLRLIGEWFRYDADLQLFLLGK